MAEFKTFWEIDGAPAAEIRARAVLRQAVGNTFRGAVRDVFDRAVTRELAHLRERGALPVAIAAFQNAAANVHIALASAKGWPSGSIWYET